MNVTEKITEKFGRGMPISALAVRFGLSESAIRYHVRKGLRRPCGSVAVHCSITPEVERWLDNNYPGMRPAQAMETILREHMEEG